jgi:uncharacterized protein YkwD
VICALRHDGHPAVRKVARLAHEPELKRAGPGPPPETDALHATVHPDCEPNHLVAASDHGLLAYRSVLPNRPRAGVQVLALATGVLLVAGLAVATLPPDVVPVALRTEALDKATAPSGSADVKPRAALVDTPPPQSEISTIHAFASAIGAAAGPEPESEPEPKPAEGRAPIAVSGTLGDVIALTNKERREAGCGALRPDARLTRAARAHASDMAKNGYFSHNSRDGRRFEHRVRAAGYPRPGAENIAKGQTSAQQVVREWMASPSHRSAMLTCGFTTIGVARVDNYWVQEFGK